MSTGYSPIVTSIVSRRDACFDLDTYILEFPFTGTSSEVLIEHNRGRLFVDAVFIREDNIQVYPKYEFIDINTIKVISNTPLIGTLYII